MHSANSDTSRNDRDDWLLLLLLLTEVRPMLYRTVNSMPFSRRETFMRPTVAAHDNVAHDVTLTVSSPPMQSDDVCLTAIYRTTLTCVIITTGGQPVTS
jgi:hypothetical protein